jgi:hypothetical protein
VNSPNIKQRKKGRVFIKSFIPPICKMNVLINQERKMGNRRLFNIGEENLLPFYLPHLHSNLFPWGEVLH